MCKARTYSIARTQTDTDANTQTNFSMIYENCFNANDIEKRYDQLNKITKQQHQRRQQQQQQRKNGVI